MVVWVLTQSVPSSLFIYQVCQTRLEHLLLDERYRATASFSVVCSLPRFPRVLIGLALTNRSIDCNPIRGSQLEAEIRTPNRFEILISTPDCFYTVWRWKGKVVLSVFVDAHSLFSQAGHGKHDQNEKNENGLHSSPSFLFNFTYRNYISVCAIPLKELHIR